MELLTRNKDRESLCGPFASEDLCADLNFLANVALNFARAEAIWKHDIELRILRRKIMCLQEQLLTIQSALP